MNDNRKWITINQNGPHTFCSHKIKPINQPLQWPIIKCFIIHTIKKGFMNRTNENQLKATTKRKKKNVKWLFHSLYLNQFRVIRATIYCFRTVHSYKMAKENAKPLTVVRIFYIFFFPIRSHLSNVKLVAIVTIIIRYVLFSIINLLRLFFPFELLETGKCEFLHIQHLFETLHLAADNFSFCQCGHSIENMFIFHIPIE